MRKRTGCACAEGLGHLPRSLRDPFGIRVGGAPREVHAATGDFDKEQNVRSREPTVSTVKKSTATTLAACVRRNSRHVGPGRFPTGPSCSSRRIFFAVVADTMTPSLYGAESRSASMSPVGLGDER